MHLLALAAPPLLFRKSLSTSLNFGDASISKPYLSNVEIHIEIARTEVD